MLFFNPPSSTFSHERKKLLFINFVVFFSTLLVNCEAWQQIATLITRLFFIPHSFNRTTAWPLCWQKNKKNKHHEVALEDELTSKSEIHFGIYFFFVAPLDVDRAFLIFMSNNTNECIFNMRYWKLILLNLKR